MKSPVGFLHNLLFGFHVQLQFVHAATVKLFKGLGIVDAVKLIEAQPFSGGRQLHGTLGHLPQHLTPREVAHVTGVSVSHQEHRLLPAQLMDALNVALSGRRADGLAFPIVAVEVLQILSQSVTPVELIGEVERRKLRVIFVSLDFLLQSRVSEV